MKDFIISNETINSNGFMVLTSGINLTRFLSNPVMYYNHDVSLGVIGRWENIRIKGSDLIATPVFDEHDETGLKIKNKVNDGFIKSASIGVEPLNFSEINGVMALQSCLLIECSICDIPSNSNAQQLYYEKTPVKDYNEYLKLSQIKPQKMNELTQICKTLGLPEKSTIETVIASIENLQNDEPAKNIKNAIKEALRLKLITQTEAENYIELGKSNPVYMEKHLRDIRAKHDNQVSEEYDALMKLRVREGAINYNPLLVKDIKAIALKDFNAFKQFICSIPKHQSIKELIVNDVNNSDKEDRSNWTLTDYRKKAPQELRNNPELYKRLLQEKTDF
jgi:hypothetical protein